MPPSLTRNVGSIPTHRAEGLHYPPCERFSIPSFYTTVPASLDLGQSNILVPRQVLWDPATRDEDPSSALRWEETAIVTPAAPWESLLAAAHRKEKVCFLQIQDFLLGPPHMLHHILTHSRRLGPQNSMETPPGLPVLVLGLVPAAWCREEPLPLTQCCPQDWAARARAEHGRLCSPAWEISKEAAFCKPHFHLTSLNIFQFQNTRLKITYRNIYMDTERNFPALGIQPTAHCRAHNWLPVQSLLTCC